MSDERLRPSIQHKLTRDVPADPQLSQPRHLVQHDIQRSLRASDDKIAPLPERWECDVLYRQAHHVLRNSEQKRIEARVGDALDPIQYHPLERSRRRRKETREVLVAHV